MKIYNAYTAQDVPVGQRRSYLYNAFDIVATSQVAEALWAEMGEVARRYYDFSRAMQAPALDMSLRGIPVNVEKRGKATAALKRELKRVTKGLNALPVVLEKWDGLEKVTGACPTPSRKDGKHKWARGVEDTPARVCVDCGAARFVRAEMNPNSADQAKHMLYDILGMAPQRNKEGKLSADEDALQRLQARYPKHYDLIAFMLEARGIKKQIGFLNARLSTSNRWHSQFNVSQAWTGRWSASKFPGGIGGNSQNIAERHRYIFEADPGFEMFYIDLKQAESNIVAHLAGDEAYIEAHALGDVHTYVTRLVWPELPWTWDIKKDKEIAKSQVPDWDPAPGHDLRFQSKRIQHGSNYGLTPRGIAIIAHIAVAPAALAQRNYFHAFPNIPRWQRWVREQVEAQEPLVNPLGLSTMLFGRPQDGHTYKQGLSVLPQGLVGHIINIAIWRIWKELSGPDLQLMAQVHDAVLGQVRRGRRDLLTQAAHLMEIPVPITDIDGVTRVARIGAEAAVGDNWGHAYTERDAEKDKARGNTPQPLNPQGLVEIDI